MHSVSHMRGAGIDGILRDYNGDILSRFSKFIGCLDPTGAELAAIMEAIKVFKSSRWVKLYKLIIESDSLLSVRWIENPRTVPSNFAEIVSNCATLCTHCSWEVRFVFKERNVRHTHWPKLVLEDRFRLYGLHQLGKSFTIAGSTYICFVA
ncbi:hypothetical protein GQ457_01G028730 [Hibiscus cannabinus]